MADSTQLNPGSGGDLILTEDVGGGVKIPVSKIYVGAHGVNGCPASYTNPLPVSEAAPPSMSAAYDAFGRARMSAPLTIFDNKQLFDGQPLDWDQQLTGTGASAYNTNQASTTLSVTNAGVGSAVRQTFRRMPYQPGKSQLIAMTGTLINEGGAGIANVTRNYGLFDAKNGLFFQVAGTTANVVVRSFTSGSAVDTVTPQSGWNLDRLDGSGGSANPSGITLDLTKVQIFVIDFQWFGTGRVRFGFYVSGRLFYCHESNTANVGTLVYMSIPNLPLRVEIVSTVAANASIKHICSGVTSEGGIDDNGFALSVDTGTTALVTGNNSNIFCLLAIRMQAAKQAALVVPEFLQLFIGTANISMRYALLLNPTFVGGTPSFTPVPNSAVEFATPPNTITLSGGTQLFSSYASNAGARTDVLADLPNNLQLGASIAGVSDIMAFAVQSTSAQGASLLGALGWREID